MTQFLPTQIPPEVTTVEQLWVWCAEILQRIYPNELVIEYLNEAGEPVDRRCIESNKFYYTAPSPPEWRHSSRGTFVIAPEHQEYGHIWEHVQPIGNTPIPVAMRKAA